MVKKTLNQVCAEIVSLCYEGEIQVVRESGEYCAYCIIEIPPYNTVEEGDAEQVSAFGKTLDQVHRRLLREIKRIFKESKSWLEGD